MKARKLTTRTIENATASKDQRREYWDSVISDDTNLPGVSGLRVSGDGTKSWVVMFRLKGRQRRVTIGRYPAFSLAEAREIAREMLMMVGQGIDPVEAAKAAELEEAEATTVEGAVRDFIERYAKPNIRSWPEVFRAFRAYVLPLWGDRRLDAITPTDVHRVLDGIVDAGHPIMANRVHAHLRRFFNWCLERELIHTSPVARIRPPASERSRDRVLNDDEICRFWDGCERLGWPFGPAYQLLLVTGQRRNEVAGMRWEDVDLDDGVWTIPREETKTTRQHEVFLAPLAVELLRGLPCLGEYAITTNGRTPVSGFSASKKRLDDIIGISDWRLHDLRRTAASKMAEIGVAPHVIDKVQNRATGAISGVAAAYNRHEHRQEKRDALYAWGKALDAIIRSVEPKLIQLKSERT